MHFEFECQWVDIAIVRWPSWQVLLPVWSRTFLRHDNVLLVIVIIVLLSFCQLRRLFSWELVFLLRFVNIWSGVWGNLVGQTSKDLNLKTYNSVDHIERGVIVVMIIAHWTPLEITRRNTTPVTVHSINAKSRKKVENFFFRMKNEEVYVYANNKVKTLIFFLSKKSQKRGVKNAGQWVVFYMGITVDFSGESCTYCCCHASNVKREKVLCVSEKWRIKNRDRCLGATTVIDENSDQSYESKHRRPKMFRFWPPMMEVRCYECPEFSTIMKLAQVWLSRW